MVDNVWQHHRSWNFVLPPSRPSRTQLERIRGALHARRIRTAAILGSTPEFVDLLYSAGIRSVDLFEKNPRFHAEMLSLRAAPPEFGSIVWGDWIDTLPAYAGRYDLVLSDLTSGNVPYDQREIFHRAVWGLLADGGILFDKLLTHIGGFLPVERVLSHFIHAPLNLIEVNAFNCLVFFSSSLVEDFGQVRASEFYSLLNTYCVTPSQQRLLELNRLITPSSGVWFYGYAVGEMRRLAFDSYRVNTTFREEPTSPYAESVEHIVAIK